MPFYLISFTNLYGLTRSGLGFFYFLFFFVFNLIKIFFPSNKTTHTYFCSHAISPHTIFVALSISLLVVCCMVYRKIFDSIENILFFFCSFIKFNLVNCARHKTKKNRKIFSFVFCIFVSQIVYKR